MMCRGRRAATDLSVNLVVVLAFGLDGANVFCFTMLSVTLWLCLHVVFNLDVANLFAFSMLNVTL